ncbi:hypothetical protein BKA69DRAFT_1044265 [Paraphysoderma sedebokerense]|nr:hypothetical protein BKA69DRAFT_1044265 [Paraphysoderma sedebokerense]
MLTTGHFFAVVTALSVARVHDFAALKLYVTAANFLFRNSVYSPGTRTPLMSDHLKVPSLLHSCEIS